MLLDPPLRSLLSKMPALAPNFHSPSVAMEASCLCLLNRVPPRTAEADHIESILAAARGQNLVDYGLHRASTALVTCFVSSTEDGRHVHFIDGADGGYTLAVQRLKVQIAEQR